MRCWIRTRRRPASIDVSWRRRTTAVNQALHQYVPVLDSSAERERVGRLQREIDEFRGTMLRVLDTDSRRWPTDARVLLRTQIVPKRELVIRVSEEVQALNRGAFVQQQKEIAEIYGAAQRRLWRNLGLALAASFGIGLVATLYAGRLENRIRQQRMRDVQNASELQHLSAKLITAQEEERRSIARELHDEVGQVLTAIKVELAVAQRDDGSRRRPVTAARGRAVHHRGRDHDGPGPLAPAASGAARRSGPARGGRVVSSQLRQATRHPHRGASRSNGGAADTRRSRQSAYRIVQEALTNVAKHARATACRVYLQRLPHTILITIEDNGAGFDPADVQRTGGGRRTRPRRHPRARRHSFAEPSVSKALPERGRG